MVYSSGVIDEVTKRVVAVAEKTTAANPTSAPPKKVDATTTREKIGNCCPGSTVFIAIPPNVAAATRLSIMI